VIDLAFRLRPRALSQRRVARLLSVERMTLRYTHHRDPQEALRVRLRELAGSRVRYCYRRLTVLLKREGWQMNAKRIYRLYVEEGLIVRTQKRRGRAQRQHVPLRQAVRPNQKWSMDFVAQRLPDGRWIRVLTVVDEFTRECLALFATTLSVERRWRPPWIRLSLCAALRSRSPLTTEPSSPARRWTYGPIKMACTWTSFARANRWRTGYIESFNGKLRDEYLNVEVFFTLADARRKLHLRRRDYNHHRPHSALADRTPAEFAAICNGGKDGGETALENATRFPLSHRPTTRFVEKDHSPSTALLEALT